MMKRISNAMANRLSSFSIKRQLILLMAGAFIMFSISQFSYIIHSYRTLTKTTLVYVDSILQEKVNKVESYINEMVSSSQALSENYSVQEYLKSTDQAERYRYVKPIRSFLQYILSSKDEIMDIAIVDHNNQFIYSGNSPIFDIQEYLLEHHSDYAGNDFDSFFDMVTTSDNVQYLVYVRPINPAFSSQHLASCITIYNNSSIQSVLRQNNITQNTRLYIYNENGIVLASSDYSSLNQELPVELTSAANASFVPLQGEKVFINSYDIENTIWKLVCTVPANDIYGDIYHYLAYTAAYTAIMLIILLFLSRSLWHNIAFPVYNLKEQLQSLSGKGRHLRIHTSSQNNEIMQIGTTINDMLTQIDELNKKIFQTQTSLYEAEILQKEAELYALQNQINPHFLYNTLDCIRDISIIYNAKEIQSISISMTKIFRYCIVKSSHVRVIDELDCINNYLNIMQIRYQNRFQIKMNIEQDIHQARMLKFILQPLIENAFYHGLECKARNGALTISGTCRENIISFVIYDTGAGIPSQKLRQIATTLKDSHYTSNDLHNHTGIGLFNIHHRIQLEYGSSYGLTLDSVEGEWTCVTVRFPFLR